MAPPRSPPSTPPHPRPAQTGRHDKKMQLFEKGSLPLPRTNRTRISPPAPHKPTGARAAGGSGGGGSAARRDRAPARRGRRAPGRGRGARRRWSHFFGRGRGARAIPAAAPVGARGVDRVPERRRFGRRRRGGLFASCSAGPGWTLSLSPPRSLSLSLSLTHTHTHKHTNTHKIKPIRPPPWAQGPWEPPVPYASAPRASRTPPARSRQPLEPFDASVSARPNDSPMAYNGSSDVTHAGPSLHLRSGAARGRASPPTPPRALTPRRDAPRSPPRGARTPARQVARPVPAQLRPKPPARSARSVSAPRPCAQNVRWRPHQGNVSWRSSPAVVGAIGLPPEECVGPPAPPPRSEAPGALRDPSRAAGDGLRWRAARGAQAERSGAAAAILPHAVVPGAHGPRAQRHAARAGARRPAHPSRRGPDPTAQGARTAPPLSPDPEARWARPNAAAPPTPLHLSLPRPLLWGRKARPFYTARVREARPVCTARGTGASGLYGAGNRRVRFVPGGRVVRRGG
jgi:hypothetical protein